MNRKYGIPYKDHDLMVLNYLEKLAGELRALNGNKFDISHYMYYAATGLEDADPRLYRPIKQQLESWLAKKNIVQQSNPWKC
jgi:hypothetical protein